MIKQDTHIFKGMSRDVHPIRQDSSHFIEAHNIRFTAIDNSSFLSVTNERGNTLVDTVDGLYLGHCVINNYVVIFTMDYSTRINYIWRVSIDDETTIKLLYKGSLNMDNKHPLQTLGIYEGEYVQKVYWVDGINQPRVINIMAKEFYKVLNPNITEEYTYSEGCFDFVRTLKLDEEVKIQRQEGDGTFSAGVIQYALSYYSKYGQESNIFYTSPLLNVSFKDRGASPEDKVSNVFNINIKNSDTSFDYIRVYSIQRTSLNATPTVKVVTDIDTSTKDINIIDTGTTGYTIDPSLLLYVGGESIIASTLAEKDNTLFLGHIKYERPFINIKDDIKENATIGYEMQQIAVPNFANNINTTYYNNFQLDIPNLTPSFKAGDTYRFGVQFQYKNGKWSEPVFIKDVEISSNLRQHLDINQFTIAYPRITLNKTQTAKLYQDGYRKARALAVFPTIHDRKILAQGLLCPTVFSVKNRVSKAPFAQSSWFFRPISKNITENTNESVIAKGATVAFRHLEPLLAGKDRGTEIQNMEKRSFSAINTLDDSDRSNINTFFVDQSIVTFHSPEIEFDEETKQALNNNDNLDLEIVGIVNFQSNMGNISLQTSSTVPYAGDTGFNHKNILSTNYENKGLISGLMYGSHFIYDPKNDDADDGYNIKAHHPSETNEYMWMVYPWQRTGSINNDCVRPEGKGTRTSVLKRKVISNLRYSPWVSWLYTGGSKEESPYKFENGITTVSVFDSNEQALIKIPSPKNSNLGVLNYYGNVDSLITTSREYPFYINTNSNNTGSFTGTVTQFASESSLNAVGQYLSALKSVKDPVRMKYKSSPHAVFAFNFNTNKSPVILPSIDGYNTINEDAKGIIPFWEGTAKGALKLEFQYSSFDNSIPSGATDIESRVSSYLKIRIPNAATGAFAVSNCSVYPDNYDYGELYVYTGTAWQRGALTSGNLGDTHKIKDVNEYWQVVKDGTSYILKRVIYSDTYDIQQDNIVTGIKDNRAMMFLAELKKKTTPDNMFGGDSEEALKNNLWIPVSDAVSIIDTNNNVDIVCKYGDTYFQRYDCLKTYSYTTEDENSVVDIASFMCETRVNLDGRYDKNRGLADNTNISPINFNLFNNIYTQKNNFFNYRILGKEYYLSTIFPTQILWSKEKSYLEDVDTWTNITTASSLDLNSTKGGLISLKVFNESLLALQEKSISQILFNSRVQIPTSDAVPIEISNNYKVEGTRVISDSVGCQDRAAIAQSPTGVYFIDSSTDTLWKFEDKLINLSDSLNNKWWFRENYPSMQWNILSDKSYRLDYDKVTQDLYIIKTEEYENTNTLCFSEKINQFTSLMSYSNSVIFNVDCGSFSFHTNDYNTSIWENYVGDYNNFFGHIEASDFTFISNDNSLYNKIFDSIEYRADVYNDNTIHGSPLLEDNPFGHIRVYNEYQDTSNCKLTTQREYRGGAPTARKKYRVWRALLPRDKSSGKGRDRISNTWAAITLQTDISDAYRRFILHDISVKYTI